MLSRPKWRNLSQSTIVLDSSTPKIIARNDVNMVKDYFVYILRNYSGNFYIGITNNIGKRVWEHKNKLADGFTKKYNIDKLVYYEIYSSPLEAITREKQIKGGSRKDKIKLIESKNPNYKDLYLEII